MNQLHPNRPSPLRFAAPDPARPHEADFDLSAMVRMVRRNARFIATITAVLTALALPFIIAIDPVYRAQARFLIHPTLAIDTSAEAAAPDLSDEVERLRSRGIRAHRRFSFTDGELQDLEAYLSDRAATPP